MNKNKKSTVYYCPKLGWNSGKFIKKYLLDDDIVLYWWTHW